VNCWEYGSLYFVLTRILDTLRVVHTDMRDTAVKRELLARALREEPLIVILDEIDKPAPQERNAILYNLGTLPNTALLCICNSSHVFRLAEERVKSRLAPVVIEFQPYSRDDLAKILHNRALHGMAGGAFQAAQLERIAELSHGDARIGIQTLIRAGLIAEREGQHRIELQHVAQARATATEKRRSDILLGLTEDHRLMYAIVSERGKILSPALYEEYRKRCHTLGRKPIAVRTSNKYQNALESAGLVTRERARTPGNVWLLKTAR